MKIKLVETQPIDPREFDLPEVLEVHVVPSVEARMVPLSPTATKSEEVSSEKNMHICTVCQSSITFVIPI